MTPENLVDMSENQKAIWKDNHQEPRCYRLNMSLYLQFKCLNLISNLTALRDGAFGRLLGHKGGVLMNEISALKKRFPELSCPFCHEKTAKRWLTMKEEVGSQHILNILVP